MSEQRLMHWRLMTYWGNKHFGSCDGRDPVEFSLLLIATLSCCCAKHDCRVLLN